MPPVNPGQKIPPQPARTANTTTAASPARSGNDAVAGVLSRNKYYKDGYSTLLKVLVIQVVIIMLLATVVVFKLFFAKPQITYFATTDDGKITQMTPLNQPNQNDSAVLSWTAQAATDIMTFNFRDYRKRLQDSSSYFTSTGWNSFMKALQDSRTLESVEKLQQIVTAVPKESPVIIDRNVAQGLYYWRVQLPLLVTYESGDKKASTTQILTLVVVRVSPLENPAGLGIEQWVAR